MLIDAVTQVKLKNPITVKEEKDKRVSALLLPTVWRLLGKPDRIN